jgi:hypothetical protein
MAAAAPPRGGVMAMWDGFQREMLAALGHVPYVRVPPMPVASMPVAQPATAAPAARPPDPAAEAAPALLYALARAAGLAVADLAARCPDLPSPAQLRGNARAKRALWPRLRALRRSPTP